MLDGALIGSAGVDNIEGVVGAADVVGLAVGDGLHIGPGEMFVLSPAARGFFPAGKRDFGVIEVKRIEGHGMHWQFGRGSFAQGIAHLKRSGRNQHHAGRRGGQGGQANHQKNMLNSGANMWRCICSLRMNFQKDIGSRQIRKGFTV